MPAIRFDGVTQRYGAVTALDDVCRSPSSAGEMFGLIGPDGAGKTTTIRLRAGCSTPDAGTDRVLGRDPVAEHAPSPREIGYLSQRFSLYGDLTHRREHRVLRRDPRRVATTRPRATGCSR